MEIKNFDKKLELNKITITNLKDTVMKNALGGNQWDTAPGKELVRPIASVPAAAVGKKLSQKKKLTGRAGRQVCAPCILTPAFTIWGARSQKALDKRKSISD